MAVRPPPAKSPAAPESSDFDLDAFLNATTGDADELRKVLSDFPNVRRTLNRNSDANLRQVLADSDSRLQQQREAFIQEHVRQVPELCQMFEEVTGCERQLQDFEDSIATFQERLTKTTEGIARVQTQTATLRYRVENRRNVSKRLKEVYEALYECDAYCDAIAHATKVDATFLHNIRMLDDKISFIADNKDLTGSAVEREITPKLTAVATRAGDRLHAFLVERIDMLAEENTNVALQQQAVERQGLYAYTFLSRYNQPIAQAIAEHYTRVVCGAYYQQMRAAAKRMEEAAQLALDATPFVPFVPVDLLMPLRSAGAVFDARGHRDVNRAMRPSEPSVGTNTPARGVAQLKNTLTVLRGKLQENPQASSLRPSTFADDVNGLRAVNITLRLAIVDPIIAQALSSSGAWVIRFADMLVRLVNSVLTEGRFVDHFFFAAGGAGTMEHEEQLLNAIFHHVFQTVINAVDAQVSAMRCECTVLCALRVMELLKNYITQSADPLPIILLQQVFAHVNSSLGARLRELLTVQCESAAALRAVQLKPLPPPPPQANSMRFVDLALDPGYGATLAPTELIRHFARVTGRLVYVNALKLEGSRVSEASLVEHDRVCFMDEVTTRLQDALTSVLEFIDMLAQRHTSTMARAVFRINAVGCVLHQFCHSEPAGLMDLSLEPAAPAAASPRRGGPAEAAVPGTSYVTVSKEVRRLEQELRATTLQFVHEDLSTVAPLVPFVDLVDRCSKMLGEEFFAAEDAAPPAAELQVSEQELLSVVVPFHKSWIEVVTGIAQRVRVLFAQGDVVYEMVVRDYFNFLRAYVERMHRIVDVCFSNSTSLKAKTVGPVMFEHEVTKLLSVKRTVA